MRIKYLPLYIAAGLCLLAFCPGCKTNEVGEYVPDWEKLDVLGDEAVAFANLEAQVWEHKPDTAQKWMRLAEQLSIVDKGVHALATGGGDPAELKTYVEAAITLADEMVTLTDPEDKDAMAMVITIRATLGLIRVALA